MNKNRVTPHKAPVGTEFNVPVSFKVNENFNGKRKKSKKLKILKVLSKFICRNCNILDLCSIGRTRHGFGKHCVRNFVHFAHFFNLFSMSSLLVQPQMGVYNYNFSIPSDADSWQPGKRKKNSKLSFPNWRFILFFSVSSLFRKLFMFVPSLRGTMRLPNANTRKCIHNNN